VGCPQSARCCHGGRTDRKFSYDGQQRRIRVIERENSVVQSDTKVLWCEDEICEERAADGVTVTRRPFTLGELVAGPARFFGGSSASPDATHTSERRVKVSGDEPGVANRVGKSEAAEQLLERRCLSGRMASDRP
jgi:hypothetical protein